MLLSCVVPRGHSQTDRGMSDGGGVDIPDNDELDVLRKYVVPEIVENGTAGRDLWEPAKRLSRAIVECPDPADAKGYRDIDPDAYRFELAATVIYWLWLACNNGHGAVRPATYADAVQISALLEKPLEDEEAAGKITTWILRKEADQIDLPLYQMAVARSIACMAAHHISTFEHHVIENRNTTATIDTLMNILCEMAKVCQTWNRTKDQYLRWRVMTRLTPDRLASLRYKESPFEVICQLMTDRDSNQFIEGIMSTTVKHVVNPRIKWEKRRDIDTFVSVVAVLDEILDIKICLLPGSMVAWQQRVSPTLPCFFYFNNGFTSLGTQFGFAFDGHLYFAPDNLDSPILVTVLEWMTFALKVDHTSPLHAFRRAVLQPEDVMMSDKFAKYLTYRHHQQNMSDNVQGQDHERGLLFRHN